MLCLIHTSDLVEATGDLLQDSHPGPRPVTVQKDYGDLRPREIARLAQEEKQRVEDMITTSRDLVRYNYNPLMSRVCVSNKECQLVSNIYNVLLGVTSRATARISLR